MPSMVQAAAHGEAYTVTKMLQGINEVMAPVVTESSSATVSLKRKLDNGIMLDTSEAEIASLDLQAKLKHAAQQVTQIEGRDRKREWVQTRRALGNALFRDKAYAQAAEKYMEALTGLDFGTTPEQRRECQSCDQLPLTCNLAAALLMDGHYEKARRVCNEALALDGDHGRTLQQRARALMHLLRFDEARGDVDKAIEVATAQAIPPRGSTTSTDRAETLEKLKQQRAEINRAEQRNRLRVHQQRQFQKNMMREAVGRLYDDKPSAAVSQAQIVPTSERAVSTISSGLGTSWAWLTSVVKGITAFITTAFYRLVTATRGIKQKAL